MGALRSHPEFPTSNNPEDCGRTGRATDLSKSKQANVFNIYIMIYIVKNFNILGLVAFIAAGIFAISWTEVKKNDEAPWYEVTESGNDPDPAKNQLINPVPLDQEPTGDCDTGELLCAVQLEVNSSTFPANMAEADSDPDVEIGETKHKD